MYEPKYIRLLIFTKQPKAFLKLIEKYYWFFEDTIIFNEKRGKGCFEINTLMPKQDFHEFVGKRIKKYAAIELDKLGLDEILERISAGYGITYLMRTRLDEIQKSL